MSENKPITAKQEANGIKWSLAKVANLKANPNNPRVIKDEKFRKLVESIRKFPKMMEIRPIVVNGDMVVLGGNMRLKACKELGLKEVPIIMADDLTDEQQREFIIKDNVGFGEWDFELLAKDWDAVELGEWGLEFPNEASESSNAAAQESASAWFLSIEFSNESEAEQLFNRLESEGYQCKIVT
jgi:hypothetical protein